MPAPTASTRLAQSLALIATHPPAVRAVIYIFMFFGFVLHLFMAAIFLFGCFAFVCVFWDVLIVLFGFCLGKRAATWIIQH